MLVLRISLVLCILGVVRIKADRGPGKNDTTSLSVPQTIASITTVVNSSYINSTTVGKTTESPPLVFPQQGFITLNKTLEELPSNYTNGNATKNSNTNTTKLTNNNETNVNTITIINNQTKSFSFVSNIVEHTSPSSPLYKVTDTEVSDLQNVPTPKSNDIDLRPVSPKIIYKDNIKPDESVVLIDNGENTEDEIRAQKSIYSEPHVALVQGQMAAILAGVFLCISVVGYVAMLSWRRYLENRYGNREMLVNEFEFDEREDMKYFSI